MFCTFWILTYKRASHHRGVPFCNMFVTFQLLQYHLIDATCHTALQLWLCCETCTSAVFASITRDNLQHVFNDKLESLKQKGISLPIRFALHSRAPGLLLHFSEPQWLSDSGAFPTCSAKRLNQEIIKSIQIFKHNRIFKSQNKSTIGARSTIFFPRCEAWLDLTCTIMTFQPWRLARHLSTHRCSTVHSHCRKKPDSHLPCLLACGYPFV